MNIHRELEYNTNNIDVVKGVHLVYLVQKKLSSVLQ